MGVDQMFRRVSGCAALIAISCAMSMSALARADSTSRVSIPAGNLRVALLEFSRQFDVDVVFQPAQVEKYQTGGAHGTYAPQDAVRILLRNSPLKVYTDQSGAMVISEPGAPDRTSSVGRDEGTNLEGQTGTFGNYRIAQVVEQSSEAVTPSSGAQGAASTSEQVSPAAAQLEEVVVTAQKRSENLQNVPISVTAVSGDQITARQIYDPSQLQFVAPSLQIKSFNAAVGATNFSVRGVGTMSFANSIEASVTTVIDGVVMGRPEMGVMNFLDIQQIEVLNGPQGMLFGKNASAGLVNITTKRPVLDKFEGSVRGEYGVMNTPGHGKQYLTQGVLNLPLGSSAAFRLNASFTHNDPLIRNLVSVPGSKWAQDQSYFKGKLLWEPTDDLSVFIAADYARATGVGSGSAADRLVLPGSIWLPEDQQLGIRPGPENAYSSYGAPTNLEFSVGGAQANIEYKFASGHVLTNILAWRKFNSDNLFDSDKHLINVLDTNWQKANLSQVTEELRIASPTGGRFDYQFGAYYYDGKTDGSVTVRGANGIPNPVPPPALAWFGIYQLGVQDSKSYAAFGQGTIHFTDRLRLTLGGRFTHDKLGVNTIVDASDVVIPFGIPGSHVQDIKQDNFSWRVSGQYDLAQDVMGYVTVARGYKGPGFNLSLDPNAPIIKPEYPTMYEVGIKSTLLNRRLILNASAYTSDFKDFQAQAFDAPSNGYILLNAGKLRSRGFELEADALPVEGLTLSAGLSFVDAYFVDFKGDRCYAGQPGCGPGSTIDSSGNRLPNAPKWTFTLSGNYKRPINEYWNGFVQAATYSRSSMNFSSNGNPNTVQGGYTLLDASAGLSSANDVWKVSLFCRNCFDKRFVTFINASSQTRTDYYQMFGLNSFRTLGLALNWRF